MLVYFSAHGRRKNAFGVRKNVGKYMPMVLETFSKFESAFPQSAYLQGFRYQIAQVYWGEKKWPDARSWLEKIVRAGGDADTFYTLTAKATLQSVQR